MPIEDFHFQTSTLKQAAGRVIETPDEDPAGAPSIVRIHPSAQVPPALTPSRASASSTSVYGYGHGYGQGEVEVELAARSAALTSRINSPGPARNVMTDEGSTGIDCCWEGCIESARCLADCLCCLPKCLCECLCSICSSGGGSC